jgi:predicted nuclease of restriction endonuclease-like (RecB) superfamily
MVEKIKELILELGYGFAFLGNQYKVSTPSKRVNVKGEDRKFFKVEKMRFPKKDEK